MVWGHAGGIYGLLTLPRETWEAIEADLLGMGWTLSDIPGRLSWRAIRSYVLNCPRGSATWRALAADVPRWGEQDSEYLLALMVDALNWLVWSKTEDGSKNRNPPERIPRPGDEAPEPMADQVRKSIEQAKAIWGG